MDTTAKTLLLTVTSECRDNNLSKGSGGPQGSTSDVLSEFKSPVSNEEYLSKILDTIQTVLTERASGRIYESLSNLPRES